MCFFEFEGLILVLHALLTSYAASIPTFPVHLPTAGIHLKYGESFTVEVVVM